MRRELGHKPLNLVPDSELIAALGGPDEQNSLYFPGFQRRGDYYPGINALTLGRLWEHVTGRHSRLPLDLISAGVGWTTAAAAERNKDYWWHRQVGREQAW